MYTYAHYSQGSTFWQRTVRYRCSSAANASATFNIFPLWFTHYLTCMIQLCREQPLCMYYVLAFVSKYVNLYRYNVWWKNIHSRCFILSISACIQTLEVRQFLLCYIHLSFDKNFFLSINSILLYKGDKKAIFDESNICYTSEARAAKLHEVKKSTFLPCSISYLSLLISAEKNAFVCVQWRLRNWLFFINCRTITFKIMVRYNSKKERHLRMWRLQGWEK